MAGRGGVGWGHDTLLHCYYQIGDVLLVSIIVCVDGEQSHDTEFIYKFWRERLTGAEAGSNTPASWGPCCESGSPAILLF